MWTDNSNFQEEFTNLLAVSYLQLAFIYVEEIEKPIRALKKMIGKSLRANKSKSRKSSKSGIKKIRRKSTSSPSTS